MKKTLLFATVFFIIVASTIIYIQQRGGDLKETEVEKQEDGFIRIFANKEEFKAQVADTKEKRAQGLSGREKLDENELLLFVFEEADRHGFWMKDMLFSIDIFWLDQYGTIVNIKENVSPDTFPTSFIPDSDALYVIEAVAGFSEKHELKEGDNFVLPEPYGESG